MTIHQLVNSMLSMLSATKIRLYPNNEQQKVLAHQFGCARWVWNEALATTQRAYKEKGKGLSAYQLKARLPELKKHNPWLKDADSQALQQSILNLGTAFKRFFEKKSRYPRFKKKRGRQSIQYPQRVKWNEEKNKLYLPKVGWVRCKIHREIEGKVKTVTVEITPTGKYHASILADNGLATPEPVQHIERMVGLDLGLTDVFVTSEGQKSGNLKHLKKAENNLRRKQKKLSRAQKGSHRRTKARLQVAGAHERVKNARKDFLHKASRQLADENQAVAVETLRVKNMMQNRRLSKAIADVGWGAFVVMLEYKLSRHGGHLVRVDQWFPSSKTCSECGGVLEKLPLSVRQWRCPACGVVHDRDVNAAQNILQQGIKILQADGPSGSARRGLRKTSARLAVA